MAQDHIFFKTGIMAYACKSRTWKTETDRSLGLRLAESASSRKEQMTQTSVLHVCSVHACVHTKERETETQRERMELLLLAWILKDQSLNSSWRTTSRKIFKFQGYLQNLPPCLIWESHGRCSPGKRKVQTTTVSSVCFFLPPKVNARQKRLSSSWCLSETLIP